MDAEEDYDDDFLSAIDNICAQHQSKQAVSALPRAHAWEKGQPAHLPKTANENAEPGQGPAKFQEALAFPKLVPPQQQQTLTSQPQPLHGQQQVRSSPVGQHQHAQHLYHHQQPFQHHQLAQQDFVLQQQQQISSSRGLPAKHQRGMPNHTACDTQARSDQGHPATALASAANSGVSMPNMYQTAHLSAGHPRSDLRQPGWAGLPGHVTTTAHTRLHVVAPAPHVLVPPGSHCRSSAQLEEQQHVQHNQQPNTYSHNSASRQQPQQQSWQQSPHSLPHSMQHQPVQQQQQQHNMHDSNMQVPQQPAFTNPHQHDPQSQQPQYQSQPHPHPHHLHRPQQQQAHWHQLQPPPQQQTGTLQPSHHTAQQPNPVSHQPISSAAQQPAAVCAQAQGVTHTPGACSNARDGITPIGATPPNHHPLAAVDAASAGAEAGAGAGRGRSEGAGTMPPGAASRSQAGGDRPVSLQEQHQQPPCSGAPPAGVNLQPSASLAHLNAAQLPGCSSNSSASLRRSSLPHPSARGFATVGQMQSVGVQPGGDPATVQLPQRPVAPDRSSGTGQAGLLAPVPPAAFHSKPAPPPAPKAGPRTLGGTFINSADAAHRFSLNGSGNHATSVHHQPMNSTGPGSGGNSGLQGSGHTAADGRVPGSGGGGGGPRSDRLGPPSGGFTAAGRDGGPDSGQAAGGASSGGDGGGSGRGGAGSGRVAPGAGAGQQSGGAGAGASRDNPYQSRVTVMVSASLDSASHIALRCRVPQELEELLRSVSGACLDTSRNLWLVPCRSFHKTRDQMCKLRTVHVKWEGELPPLVQAVHRASSALHDDSGRYSRLHETLDDLGQSLDQRMMPFQREGVQFALRNGGRVLIGDEMGLGKTVQGCSLLTCYQDDWPALVVTPSSLRQQWADALKKWSGVLEVDIHIVFTKSDTDLVIRAHKQRLVNKSQPLAFRILIISYDYVSKLKTELHGLGFGCVLLDEAHFIKSHNTQRTKSSLPLLQHAKRAILLTGTPALSRPIELLTLMQAVLPSAGVSLDDFADRYCVPNRFSKTGGARNTEELNRLITGTFMIRRRKTDVLKQLPPKTRQQVYLRVDDKAASSLQCQQDQLKHIKSVLASVNTESGNLLFGLHQEQRQAIMQLYRKTAQIKVPAVQQYIKDVIENGVKFLVFAHHHDLLDGIEKAVNECKKRYIRIDGKTDSRQRDSLRAQFQEDEDTQVAILGIAAAGVGLTLTAASTVLFAELSWVPGEIMQAEDRVHRIGQENNVNIQFLLVKQSIDDIMWETLQSKLSSIGKVLDGKQDSLKVVSTTENTAHGPLDAYLQSSTAAGGGGGTGQGRGAGAGRAGRPAAAATGAAEKTTPEVRQQCRIDAFCTRNAAGGAGVQEEGQGAARSGAAGRTAAAAPPSLKRLRDWDDDD